MSAIARSIPPVLFLSHGGGPAAFLDFKGTPFHDIDQSSRSASFLRGLKEKIGQDFTRILVISAHWEEREFTVDYQVGAPKLFYDYYGFPEESYAPHLTYPVKSDSQLAQHVHELLTSSGIKSVLKPRKEGLDHGVFIPLKLAFPEASIPVVQLSLNANLDIATHIRLGEALAPLRREGVLIIGSGQISHNLQAARGGGVLVDGIDVRTLEFTNYFKELLESTTADNYAQRREQLIASPSLAPHFAFQHPRTEHFIPLAVAFGAAKPPNTRSSDGNTADSSLSCGNLVVQRMFHDVGMGTMAVDSYMFSS